VIQNTSSATWKTCRRTLGPVSQSYVQETEYWSYETGISKQSPCFVCHSFIFNVILGFCVVKKDQIVILEVR
jgi:hypothetical protein